MHEIKVSLVVNPFPESMRHTLTDAVPAHLRHLEARTIFLCQTIKLKAYHLARQQAQTRRITLFTPVKQHLLTNTDAEQWFVTRRSQYCILQAGFAQTTHTVGHGTLPW